MSGRRWQRTLRLGLWTFLAVLVVLLGIATLVFGTASGSRWALRQVPELQVDNFTGQLAGEWRADHVLWAHAGTQIDLSNVGFIWRPSCLLQWQLCLESVRVERLAVQLPASTDPKPHDAQDIRLPAVQLPVSVHLAQLQIGTLLIDGHVQASAIDMAADWTASGLDIVNLRGQRETLHGSITGHIDPSDGWPMRLQGQIDLPAPEQKPWSGAFSLQGDLQNDVHVQLDTLGYLNARLEGQIAPLAARLPAQLQLRSTEFIADNALPATLALQQLELQLKGNLDQGYAVRGSANLPAIDSPMALALDARLTAQGAQVQTLSVQADETHKLQLSGEMGWHADLTAKAALDWGDFPWQRLYPGMAEPPVRLQKLHAELSYATGNYLGYFNANLLGPAGEFQVSSPVSGDSTALHLLQLELHAGQGKAAGLLDLRFADGVAWKTDLKLSAIDPAYWVAQLPGSLGGRLQSAGSLENRRLQLNADLNLSGTLRGQPTTLQMLVDGKDDPASSSSAQWNLTRLDFRLGANTVHAQGQIDRQLAAQAQFDMPALAQLWPQLQGQLKGTLALSGSLNAPQGRLDVQGQNIGLEQNRLRTLALKAAVDNAQRGQLNLQVAGIAWGDRQLGTLQVDGQGNAQRHAAQISLQGPQGQLALGFNGNWQNGSWRGELASGTVHTGGQGSSGMGSQRNAGQALASQDWRLDQPATLTRSSAGQIDLGAHCWRSSAASLCGDPQRLAPEPRLSYHLKQFPLASLAAWWPKDFAWEGQLNGDIQLQVPAAGPSGHIQLDASGGVLKIREADGWQAFPYRTLLLTSDLGPKSIDSRLRFQGERLGELSLSAQLDPRTAAKPLRGEFDLKGLDISIARPFVPLVERLTGQLNGSGQLAGTLLAPQVSGVLKLNDANIEGKQLPVGFNDLNVQAAIAGASLRLNGAWRSGKFGHGTLTGQIDWQHALVVDVQLAGEQLPATVEPYATLEVAPQLHVQMAGERLAISGTVQIPRGAITVHELPPATVKLSNDAVIVGQQASSKAPALAMDMNIDVDVGQDKLTFTGFGLGAELVGHVHIGNNLDTRGELNLNHGRYRAYGQNLDIRRARLLFTGPIDQPYLDIEAVRKTDDVIAGIRLTGSAEQPTSEVFAEPAMSQEQALSYLVLGRPLTSSGGDNNALAQAALGLGLAGSSGVTGKLADNLGIKDFQLDTQGSGNTTSVVASGNISEKLTLRYGVGVFDPVNTVALRYALTKRVYVEAASGLASSLDIFYERDF